VTCTAVAIDVGLDDLLTLSTGEKIANPRHERRDRGRGCSWAQFRNLLEYKATWHGREVIAVDRFFPSSQLCLQHGRCRIGDGAASDR
jgi:putative transposase